MSGDLSFPSHDPSVPRVSASPQAFEAIGAARLGQALILIVDDSRTIHSLLSGILRRKGFTNLLHAEDGQQGLELALARRPSLIITDLLMPKMDGFELCQRLRAHPEMRNTPILVQTSLESPGDRTKVFAVGATDLILKPIEPNEMMGRVLVHLEQQRLMRDLAEYKDRIQQELVQARRMQESLLPSPEYIAALKDRHPIDIASLYQPSIELGGDIWSIQSIDETSLRLYTADFSGHGVGSAINTFRMQTYLAHAKDQPVDPALWLEYLNGFLCDALQVGQFATMFCCVVDFKRREIQFASAAAPPALLRRGSGAEYEALDASGFPLGITRSATFETHRVSYGSGARLFLYSDALIETPDPPEAEFTPETLCDALNAQPENWTLHHVQAALFNRLVGPQRRPVSDDLTLVSVALS